MREVEEEELKVIIRLEFLKIEVDYKFVEVRKVVVIMDLEVKFIEEMEEGLLDNELLLLELVFFDCVLRSFGGVINFSLIVVTYFAFLGIFNVLVIFVYSVLFIVSTSSSSSFVLSSYIFFI